MLKIKNLNAVILDQDVLSNINLEVNAGEIHAIMGPQHSGKSTLVHAILGTPSIDYTSGEIDYKGSSITDTLANERSLLGIFVSFQDPPTIDGITNLELVKSILKLRKDPRLDSSLEKDYKALCVSLGLSSSHGNKIVNHESITPTERKKNELLHMLLLTPDLIVLDEIDAGVDDDELECIATTIKSFLDDKNKAAIVVTHSHKLLDLLVPDQVHVMVDGEIVEQGSTELYKRIVEDGYPQFS